MMASNSKTPKGWRGARTPKPVNGHFKACEAEWKAEIRKPIAKGAAPDGKKIAIGLRKLHEITGEPLFVQAATALQAYGLAGRSPGRSAERVWESNTPEWLSAPSLMFGLMMDARDKTGKMLTDRAAAAKAVARLGLTAPNSKTFDAAVEHLRKRYAKWEKEGFPQFELGEIGTIFVVPVEGRVPKEAFARCLPKEGKDVPNNLPWRKVIARGDVTVRVKSWRELPPNSAST
jgi:hypothetical protein